VKAKLSFIKTMSDINLLPPDLREGEKREHKQQAPTPSIEYTKPSSQLQERLEELREKPQSLWGHIKQWFMKPPPPPGVVEKPVVAKTGSVSPVAETKTKSFTLETKAQSFKKVPQVPILATQFNKQTILTKQSPVQTPKPPLKITPDIAVPETKTGQEVPLGVLLDVNLLPAESRAAVGNNGHAVRLAIIAGVALLLIGIVYAVLLSMIVSNESQVTEMKRQAQNLASQIKAFQPRLEELQFAGRKVKAIRQLVANRNNWLQLFSKLQELTLPNVSFGSMSANGTGEVVLNAEAMSIGDLARQLKIFEDNAALFSSVTMGNISASSENEQGATLAKSVFQLKLVPNWDQAETNVNTGN
jgi:hypothetical protein